MSVAQKNRGERGRERERVERGNGNGKRDRERELAEEDAGGAGKECHRNEHGDEHERGGDDGAGDFLHGHGSGVVRFGNSFGDMALHVFDDDDGVVHDEAGGERDAEERERVDREAEKLHEGKRSDERNGNRDRGDKRAAPVLQENENHEDDENDCFEQRVENVVDRFADDGGGVERDGVLDAGREALREALEVRPCAALSTASALALGNCVTPKPTASWPSKRRLLL